jgi:hypothetical protein
MFKVWVSVCVLGCCQGAYSQQLPAPVASDELAEVQINSQREKLGVMRTEMASLEDRFNTAYNALNKNRQFDVVCTTEARTGTLMQSRSCRPAFIDDATAAVAQGNKGGFLTAEQAIFLKQAEYRKNLLAVIGKNPALAQLLKDRVALQKRYEALSKQIFKGKVAAAE